MGVAWRAWQAGTREERERCIEIVDAMLAGKVFDSFRNTVIAAIRKRAE